MNNTEMDLKKNENKRRKRNTQTHIIMKQKKLILK